MQTTERLCCNVSMQGFRTCARLDVDGVGEGVGWGFWVNDFPAAVVIALNRITVAHEDERTASTFHVEPSQRIGPAIPEPLLCAPELVYFAVVRELVIRRAESEA